MTPAHPTGPVQKEDQMSRRTLGSLAPRSAPVPAAKILATQRRMRPLLTARAILAAPAMGMGKTRSETLLNVSQDPQGTAPRSVGNP